MLVGDIKAISNVLADLNEDTTTYTMVPASTPEECAEKAVALVRGGEADVLMKGLIQTATFLRPVFDKKNGIENWSLG